MHSVKASERSGSYTTSEAEQKKWMLASEGLELRSGIFFWAKFKRHIPHCKPSSPCFSTASGNSTGSQLTSYSRVLVCLFFLLTARTDFDVRIRALCFARAESQPSLPETEAESTSWPAAASSQTPSLGAFLHYSTCCLLCQQHTGFQVCCKLLQSTWGYLRLSAICTCTN